MRPESPRKPRVSGPSGPSKSRAERKAAGWIPIEIDLRPAAVEALAKLVDDGYAAAGRSGRAGAIEQAILDAAQNRHAQSK